MKKILFTLIFTALIIVPIASYAQNSNVIAPLNSGDMKSPIENTQQAYNLLISIVRWVYTIFFIIAVLFILFAAYNFILGGRDEAKLKVAKNQLKYAVIAIAIALVSAGLATLVKNILQNQSAGNQNTTITTMIEPHNTPVSFL